VGLEVVDWMCLAQDGNWWQSVVNMMVNLWVLWGVGSFLTNVVTASQGELCSIGLVG